MPITSPSHRLLMQRAADGVHRSEEVMERARSSCKLDEELVGNTYRQIERAKKSLLALRVALAI